MQMKYGRNSFKSTEEIKQFVELCEKGFTERVEEICRHAIEADTKLLTLSGPSCSGKTTTAEKLKKAYFDAGIYLHVVSIDDFYYDRDILIKRSIERGESVDYDSPETIDINLFASAAAEILAGGTAIIPKFSFKEGRRTGLRRINCTENDAFLFEGIQAVYPELTRHLSGSPVTSMFISVENGLDIDGVVFEPREIRFIRRLVRDSKFRDTTAVRTFENWSGVVKNEDIHIYPNIGTCTERIDSMLPYEINVIKPYAVELLSAIPSDSVYFKKAHEIMTKLEKTVTIPSEFVPENSVFREFIGNAL